MVWRVISSQQLDPWGKVTSGGLPPTTLSFTGQKLDGTGLLDYHARMYDPVLGRFISPDSIIPSPGNPQSLNRYSYVQNNPLKYTDPTGHCDSGDKACNEIFDKVRNHGNIVGGIPTGLDEWGWDKLTILLWWLDNGIRLTYDGTARWTADNVWSGIIQALSQIHKAFGSDIGKMGAALGFGGSRTLTFNKIAPPGPGNRPAQAVGDKDRIDAWFGNTNQASDVGILIHEMGHIADWNARPKGATTDWTSSGTIASTGLNWINSIKWVRITDDEWRILPGGDKGVVSNYALLSPREDFAETFTWWVTGIGSTPSSLRQEGLKVALKL